MSVVARRVAVRGVVQGVGYRYAMVEAAQAAGVVGWVRNRRDGSVEAVFGGPAATVAAMIEACRRGPSSARVEAVHDEAGSADMLNLRRAGERFSVLPTI